ncbi:hypothetical protein DAEQUDRAFT_322696 [Daedalea quercina L-15889]|uniref:Secreted protein n=1 Tax=Daedalea quercina L-15889 TaxID=1314783 RepID=A0A165PSQ3_9APHY|nr:hypothetical protein DAEQUDRAFT_322696 [Daedalea quercina L-15889]
MRGARRSIRRCGHAPLLVVSSLEILLHGLCEDTSLSLCAAPTARDRRMFGHQLAPRCLLLVHHSLCAPSDGRYLIVPCLHGLSLYRIRSCRLHCVCSYMHRQNTFPASVTGE